MHIAVNVFITGLLLVMPLIATAWEFNGLVLDTETGDTVRFASVLSYGSGEAVFIDSNGRFTIEAGDSARVLISVHGLGFKGFTHVFDSTSCLSQITTIALTPAPRQDDNGVKVISAITYDRDLCCRESKLPAIKMIVLKKVSSLSEQKRSTFPEEIILTTPY